MHVVSGIFTICLELSGGSNSKRRYLFQYVSNSFLAEYAKIKFFFEIQCVARIQPEEALDSICAIILIFVFVSV